MPSKKILSLLIICIGIVASIWVFQNKEKVFSASSKLSGSLTSENDSAGVSSDQDFKNILTSTTTITATSTAYADENTTYTSQISRDFFVKYLEAKKEKGTLSEDDANQIALETLSAKNYTNAIGTQYTATNLHITKSTDTQTVSKYQGVLTKSLTTHAVKNAEDVTVTVQRAITLEKPAELAKLDPVIASCKAILSDMLAMTVPADAVSAHLAFMNALSNMIANTEAFRAVFDDPVKSFSAIGVYDEHKADLSVAMHKLDTYFKSKQ